MNHPEIAKRWSDEAKREATKRDKPSRKNYDKDAIAMAHKMLS